MLMSRRLALDLETYCEVPITNGTYIYAESAEVLLVAWAWDDGPVTVWDVTEGEWERWFKRVLQDMIDQADEIVVHAKSDFDPVVLRYQGLTVPPEKITNSSVLALQHSLPAGLGELCDVLGVPTDKAKDKAGKKLIQRFCKPLPKNQKLRRATRDTHPEEWAAFKVYAGLDVESMREVLKRIPRWNDTPIEREYWLLDQRMNARGIYMDLDLARAALRAFERTKKTLSQRTRDLTDGAVASTTQRDALLAHLASVYDFDMVDMRKGTVTALMDGDLPPGVRALLEIRQEAAAASPAKYKSALKCTSADSRLRGAIQFCGAARTGRDAGRLFQTQNVPRPTLKPWEIELAIRCIKADCEDLLYENVSEICVNAVRGVMASDDGCKLVVADLSNIEGRYAAWLAGEEWKLRAFRDYDKGVGHDLYILAYAKSFNMRPEDVTKALRQIGKVMELAFQFGGAVGAFATMGANYGVSMPEEEVVTLVKAWRAAHPRIRSMWYAIEDAIKSAIRFPKERFEVRDLQFDIQTVAGIRWLRVRMPSGRYLSYPNPRIGAPCARCEGSGRTFVAADTEVDCPDCDGTGKSDYQVRYDGVDQYTKKWGEITTWGGKCFENVVQAGARDVFMRGMKAAEAAGYPVVTRVHDELVCETPDNDNYTAEGLSAIMATNPSWALGLPLAAAGAEMKRYAKGD